MLALLTDNPSLCHRLSPVLLSNGIFHYVEGLDKGLMLCDAKEIGGVILDTKGNFETARILCTALRARYPEMPIAALLDDGTACDMPADRSIRAEDGELWQEVSAFCHAVMGRERQILSLHQLYITENANDTRYLGYPLQLSTSEHLLLLCLTYLAPRVVPPEELHRLCDPLGLHSAKSLAVRISAINQKAREIHPRTLICNAFKRGYTLNTDVL